jgi:hypothetical protein
MSEKPSYIDRLQIDLDRLARRCHEMREKDERWRQASMKIDAARGIVRQMMHPKRRGQ